MIKYMKTQKNTLVRYAVTGIGTFAVFVGSVSPSALASLTVNINGNGATSENNTSIEISQQTAVVQQNGAQIKNDINSEANTGKNTVAENVGDAHIKTGDITNNVNVQNTAGSNIATGTFCAGCPNGELAIGIEGNGASSTSSVAVASKTNNAAYQTNNGSIINDVQTKLNTGYNTSKKNVGNSYIHTGGIVANVDLNNVYGTNAYVGNKGGTGFDGTITVKGNGAYANVDISVALEHLNEYLQSNEFWIFNKIDEKHNTGNNDCIKNVGDCHITTGGITSGVNVDNQGGENVIGGPKLPDLDDEDPDDDTDTPDESIIDKIIDKIIPDAIAAVTDDPADDSVLGATQLPLTGFGAMPTVLWREIALALFTVVTGLYLRHLFGRLERRYANKVRI